MKRAPAVLLAAWLLLAQAAAAQGAQDAEGERWVLQGINALRREEGLRQLDWDDALGRTAELYARALAARGLLSHRDEAGRSALQRYHLQGGTAVLVGEVLGIGPERAAVLAAWRHSPSHRDTLLDERFTHAGAGSLALADGAQLWVALFTRLLVEELHVSLGPGGYRLEGRFSPAAGGVVQPLLLSGIRVVQPEAWQAGERRFRFLVPESQGALYHRLGYLGEEGRIRITDVLFPARLLTSAPGTAPR